MCGEEKLYEGFVCMCICVCDVIEEVSVVEGGWDVFNDFVDINIVVFVYDI